MVSKRTHHACLNISSHITKIVRVVVLSGLAGRSNSGCAVSNLLET